MRWRPAQRLSLYRILLFVVLVNKRNTGCITFIVGKYFPNHGIRNDIDIARFNGRFYQY